MKNYIFIAIIIFLFSNCIWLYLDNKSLKSETKHLSEELHKGSAALEVQNEYIEKMKIDIENTKKLDEEKYNELLIKYNYDIEKIKKLSKASCEKQMASLKEIINEFDKRK